MSNKINILFYALKKMAYEPDFSIIENCKAITQLKEKFEIIEDRIAKDKSLEQRDLYSEFIDLNSLKFLEWNPIKKIGDGAFGSAFLMEDGRILKLTTASSETLMKDQLIGGMFNNSLLNSGAGQPMIYESGILDIPLDIPTLRFDQVHSLEVGYSISERLNTNIYNKSTNKFEYIDDPSGSSLQILIDQVGFDIDHIIYDYQHDNHYQGKSLLDISREGLDLLIDKVLKRTGQMHIVEQVKKQYDLREDFLFELIKTMIQNKISNRLDMHSGNVGVRNGLLVFFDF